MELHTKSNLWLLGSGALLFVLGALTVQVTLLLNQTVTPNPPTESAVKNEATKTDVAQTTATGTTISESVVTEQEWLPELATDSVVVDLPTPNVVSEVSLETALNNRRSNRAYAATPIELTELGQMLWAAVGINDTKTGKRTVPSRGEAYPVTVYVGVERVNSLPNGLYRYLAESHQLELVRAGNQSMVWSELTGQTHPQNAAAVLLLAADMERGEEFYNSTLQESGHVGQNLYLQASALNLHMLVMGGFDRKLTNQYVDAKDTAELVYMVPVGNPATE
jgi:SagB-type dehydrogenase family enzyme